VNRVKLSRAWPKLATGAAILAVAVTAGWISYQHVEDLSLSLHQSLLTARLMPVAIDGLITVGSVVLLQSGSPLGWLGIGPGAALSLFANAESGIRYGWLAAVWAAVPSASFALATFVLERWLVSQAKGAVGVSATVSDTIQTVADTPVDAPADVPGVPVDDPVSVTAPAPASAAAPSRPVTLKTATRAAPKPAQKSAERAFADELGRGDLPSIRRVMQTMRVGAPRARIIRDELAETLREAPQAA
jgi:hypothetical protein